MLFYYHKQRKPPKRRSRRRPLPYDPITGCTRISGMRLSDPDYHKEKAEAEAAALEPETAA
jgi:hypothetical protein